MSDYDESAVLPPLRPLCGHDMGWKAHRLERVEGGEYLFRALPGQVVLLRFAGGVGYAAMGLGIFAWIATGQIAALAICGVVGALFLGASVLLRPAVERAAAVSSSRRTIELPEGLLGRETRRVRFEDVEAVQYVPYRAHGSEPLRVIHGEIDLLLRTGRRLNVVNHNALDRMREDASALARIVGVPLHTHAVHDPTAVTAVRRGDASERRA